MYFITFRDPLSVKRKDKKLFNISLCIGLLVPIIMQSVFYLIVYSWDPLKYKDENMRQFKVIKRDHHLKDLPVILMKTTFLVLFLAMFFSTWRSQKYLMSRASFRVNAKPQKCSERLKTFSN